MTKNGLFETIKDRIQMYGKAMVVRKHFGLSTIVRVDELASYSGPGGEHLPHRITVGGEGYLVEGYVLGQLRQKPLDYKNGYAPPICQGAELYCDLDELIKNEDIISVH